MSLYKESYKNREDEIIFGDWAIGLSICSGFVGVAGGIYGVFCLRDILVAHGLKPEEMPIAFLVVMSFVCGFALCMGLFNLFALARHFQFPKLPKRTYKFPEQ